MIDLNKFFDCFDLGMIVIPPKENFYITPKACSYLACDNDISASSLKDLLKKMTGISLEDVIGVCRKERRDLVSFTSFPKKTDDEERVKLGALKFYYFFSDAKDNAASNSIMIIIRKAKSQAKAREIKHELTAMAVHDIKTPLSSVKESSSLVWDGTVGELNEMQKKCMDIAHVEINRLQSILEEIIRIGDFDEHSVDEDFSLVNIAPLMQRITNLTKEKCLKKKITISLEITLLDEVKIFAEKEKLKSSLSYILGYVLDNALDNSKVVLKGSRNDTGMNLEFIFIGSIPPKDIRDAFFTNFWEDKQKTLIRKDNIDAFSLRMSYFVITDLGGKLSISEDGDRKTFNVVLPVV